MISDKFITRYLSFAAGYTLIHKLPKIWNGKIESEKYNENYKQVVYNRSLLIGEKVSIMGMSMIYSPLLAIPWMLDDISRMEIYFKKLDKTEYGFNNKYKNLLDYIYRCYKFEEIADKQLLNLSKRLNL